MSLRHDVRALVREMEQEDEAAHNLWSWLPSHDEARQNHGDYWQEVQPDPATVMREAATYLAALSDVVTPEQRAAIVATENERSDWYGCPCGEAHNAPEDEGEGS